MLEYKIVPSNQTGSLVVGPSTGRQEAERPRGESPGEGRHQLESAKVRKLSKK